MRLSHVRQVPRYLRYLLLPFKVNQQGIGSEMEQWRLELAIRYGMSVSQATIESLVCIPGDP